MRGGPQWTWQDQLLPGTTCPAQYTSVHDTDPCVTVSARQSRSTTQSRKKGRPTPHLPAQHSIRHLDIHTPDIRQREPKPCGRPQSSRRLIGVSCQRRFLLRATPSSHTGGHSYWQPTHRGHTTQHTHTHEKRSSMDFEPHAEGHQLIHAGAAVPTQHGRQVWVTPSPTATSLAERPLHLLLPDYGGQRGAFQQASNTQPAGGAAPAAVMPHMGHQLAQTAVKSRKARRQNTPEGAKHCRMPRSHPCGQPLAQSCVLTTICA